MPVVTWADSPATTTPLDAAELNAAFGGCLQADGSVNSTAATPVHVTLSGSNKVVARWVASDGKDYSILVRTDGKLTIYDNTDSVSCLEIAASGGGLMVNGVAVPLTGAHSTSAFTLSAGAGAPGTLATGEVYFQLS